MAVCRFSSPSVAKAGRGQCSSSRLATRQSSKEKEEPTPLILADRAASPPAAQQQAPRCRYRHGGEGIGEGISRQLAAVRCTLVSDSVQLQ